jgi:hypothetical protein
MSPSASASSAQVPRLPCRRFRQLLEDEDNEVVEAASAAFKQILPAALEGPTRVP